MSTAKQLISAFVDAPPLYWDRSYVQNMREIRGYPNWWRIRDDVAYIDGPPNEGEQYTKDLYVWSVEIVKDEDTGENTNKLELYDLDNTLEESTSVVNGETVYRWKYREQEPELTYEHTDVIDSVSLEFDQSGRRMVAFESMGDVFLIWYDSQASATVVTNWGAGYTPQIVTDSYIRTGGTTGSTRILFYVDNATKQIVYRLQDDRFGVVYTMPSAPGDIVEILKVSKNLYGGLTVLYCYEDSPGSLKTGSFTARSAEDQVEVGTDGFQDIDTVAVKAGTIVGMSIGIKEGLITAGERNSLALSSQGLVFTDFLILTKEINLPPKEDSISLNSGDLLFSNFLIKSVVRVFEDQRDAVELASDSLTMPTFTIAEALISTEAYDSISLEATSITFSTFSIG